ncbi:MAG: hypothetical protein M3248_06135 [Actinomycetota bacterium]|nr:hypothetical protein [Actinomycetota bacterium]
MSRSKLRAYEAASSIGVETQRDKRFPTGTRLTVRALVRVVAGQRVVAKSPAWNVV